MLVSALLSALSSQAPGSLEVFAAASLRESFQAIARDFESKHPGVAVHLSFAGSQQLTAQVNQGAPCDVFASADERNLDKVAYDPNSRRVFALNRLVIVTPAGAGSVRSFRDLGKPMRIVLAAPAVPAGAYAQDALRAASREYGAAWLSKVQADVVSQEQDVRGVLVKVELGEADAGVVYASDALSAGAKAESVPIPEQFQPRIAYPIAIPRGARDPHLAREFVKSILEPPGQRELALRGFVSPLGPRKVVMLLVGSKRTFIPTRWTLGGWKTVTAVGPDKKPHSYRGVPLALFVRGAAGKTIELVGADEYTVTLPLSQVLKAGSVLVASKPGNLQLIIPGLPPHDWVDWLTEIRVK